MIPSVRLFSPRVLACAFIALAWSSALWAQPSATAPAPRVTKVMGTLGVGEIIQVTVDGLDVWALAHDPTKLVPFVDGRAIRGNYPAEVHRSGDAVLFDLAITPQNRAVWVDLLGTPDATRKPVEFSVGLEDDTPFATTLVGPHQPMLVVIEPLYGWISLSIVLVTVIAFVLLARNTGILRDTTARPAPGLLAPYNLGRAQMAFWFLLTFTSYIAIWLITGAIDTITPSLLGLMGISAGTALGEVLIDANKDAAAGAKLQNAAAAKQALEQGIADLQAQLAPLAAKAAPTVDDATVRDSLNRQLLDQRTRLAQASQQVNALATTSGSGVSQGFLRDILSDGSGYSFHRFQIGAWTIAMGLVFVSAVYNTLTMPNFSATMLGLMGMSSGTYIGFKFPEQR